MRINPILIVLAAAMALVSINLADGRGADQLFLAGNHPEGAKTLPSVGNADLNQPLAMEVHFALRNSVELDSLLKEQQDPSSPNFRKWLKTGEFDRRFGPPAADVNAVANWLRGEGFTIASATPRRIEFSGDVDHAQRSFAVRIARFDDGTTYANVEDPTVPAQFAGLIGAISGLDNMGHVVPAASTSPSVIIGGTEAFGPQDIRTFYDETVASGSDGTGSCIAIISFSDVSPDGLDLFDTQFGLPAINLVRVVQSTNPGRTGDGDEQGAEQDLEWTHAMAPGATEKLFLGATGNSPAPFFDDIGNAVEDNTCSVVDLDADTCGFANSEFTAVYDPQMKQAAAQGQSVFVLTGGFGAAGLMNTKKGCTLGNKRSVNELSADPFVTSVGGTQSTPPFDQNGNVTGYSQETTWDFEGLLSGAASGGGVSAIFAKPDYQTGPGVPADTNRDVPDVGLEAGPPLAFFATATANPPVLETTGGTELATDLMAGFTSVLDQQLGERLGNLNEVIYPLARQQYGPLAAANGFHDITTGNNTLGSVVGFSAGPGYDQTTGWGSIDFDVFAAAVKSNPLPSMTATPTPAPTPTTAMLPSPVQINFAGVDPGSSGTPREVRITNKGEIEAIVGTASVPAGFVIGSDECSGKTVAPKKRCTMTVAFSPSAPTMSAGSLSVPYNGGTATVIISGSGIAITLKAPASVKFAPVAVGSTGAQKLIAISNPSKTTSVLMGTAELSGPFIKSSDTCSGASIPPRKSCAIGVEFAPTSMSTTSGSLSISFTYGSNSGVVPTITLTGKVK
jgi:pseudomonalisin